MQSRRALPALALILVLAGCGPRFVEPPPPVGDAELTAERFIAADGIVLPLHRWEPEGDPIGVVLALHSFGDFGLAFEEVGPKLAARGFRAVAPDLRGFGSTAEFGRWWGRVVLVDDATTLAKHEHVRAPNVPPVLLGESMGGAVAMLAAAPAGADAIVLAGLGVRAELPYRWAWDRGIDGVATVFPRT